MASYITGFVIEKNDIVFINQGTPLTVGAIMEIPTPDGGGFIDADYWAVPINEGMYGGFNYIPYNLNNPSENVAPTVDSYACVRISSTKSSDWYMVLGTSAEYVTAAGGGTALPVVWPARSHTYPLLPVCQTMNQTDADGNYIAVLGLPYLDGVDKAYFPFGNFNGVALTAATANGYTSTGSLLTFLNSGTWANVGTWSVSGDSLTLLCTQTDGPGTDVFCGDVIAINPSS